MKKAIFLDFYGTVVHEDGDVIKKITQEIYETGKVADRSEIGIFWWKEFQRLFNNSYGDTFRTQRDLEIQSLQNTIQKFHSTADALQLSNLMFELALRTTGHGSDEVVHIGDSLSSDIKGANEVGIQAVWINRNNREVPKGVLAVTKLTEIFNVF